MKVLVLVCSVLMLCVVALSEKQDQLYPTRWDNLNIDQIFASERLTKNYANCLLDRGACTPAGQDIKRVLPEALQTECRKCSTKQKNGVEKAIKFLIKNRFHIFEEIEAKYDPTKSYRVKYPQYFEGVPK